MSIASATLALAAAVRDKLNAMTPRLLPMGGTVGQVVTKTGPATGAASWQDPATGGPTGIIDGGTPFSIHTPGTGIDGGGP